MVANFSKDMGVPITRELFNSLKPIGSVKFPKPLKKPKWTMIDYARKAKTRKLLKLKSNFKGVIAKRRGLVLPKEKTRWQLIKILDGMVSDFVLVKVCKGICMRCGKKHSQHTNSKGELKWDNYGSSHYWARDYMGARFEEDNLDGLCWYPCHAQKWEHDKNGQYRDYMVKKLGKKGFEKLELKARAVTKFSTQDIKFMIDNFETIWKK